MLRKMQRQKHSGKHIFSYFAYFNVEELTESSVMHSAVAHHLPTNAQPVPEQSVPERTPANAPQFYCST